MQPRIAASALAFLCATSCASGTRRDEPRLVFQAVEIGNAPVVRVYSDESVVVTLHAEQLRFSDVDVTYPRTEAIASNDGPASAHLPSGVPPEQTNT